MWFTFVAPYADTSIARVRIATEVDVDHTDVIENAACGDRSWGFGWATRCTNVVGAPAIQDGVGNRAGVGETDGKSGDISIARNLASERTAVAVKPDAARLAATWLAGCDGGATSAGS